MPPHRKPFTVVRHAGEAFYHLLKYWVKEKMIEKNIAIRLAAANKTIQKLEDDKHQSKLA